MAGLHSGGSAVCTAVEAAMTEGLQRQHQLTRTTAAACALVAAGGRQQTGGGGEWWRVAGGGGRTVHHRSKPLIMAFLKFALKAAGMAEALPSLSMVPTTKDQAMVICRGARAQVLQKDGWCEDRRRTSGTGGGGGGGR